jgi:acyl carrier protein
MHGEIDLTVARVREVMASVLTTFDVAALDEERPFFEVGIDSLDQAQILMAIEERFGLRVADGEFDRCDSLANVVRYFAERAAAPEHRAATPAS